MIGLLCCQQDSYPGSSLTMQAGNTNQPITNDLSDFQEKINEAEVYLTQGLFEEARQIYQQLLNNLGSLQKEAPVDPALRSSYESHRGFVQEQLAIIDRQEADFHGQPAEAEQEKPAAALESQGKIAFNRGQAFLDTGLLADAIEEFKLAGKMGVHPIECSLQIGKAHIQMGKHQDGIQVLESAYRSQDLSDDTRNLFLGQMAMGYEAAGDKAKALKIYQKLAANDPKNLTAANKVKSLTANEGQRYHLNMAKLHLQNRQFAKALKTLHLIQSEQQVTVDQLVPLYQEVLEKDPSNTDASQQLSAIYRQMLDEESAGADTRLEFARHLIRIGQLEPAVSEYLEVMLEDSQKKMTALN